MDCGPQTDSGLGREPGVEGGVADKPSQRATLAAQRAGREAQCGRRGQGWVPRGRHSDLGSAHRPHGTAERTNTPLRQSAGSEKKQTPSNPAAQRPAGGAKCAHARDRGRTSGTQSRAHKPRDTEDGLRGLRMCSGGWGWAQRAEDGLRGLRMGPGGWGWAQGGWGWAQGAEAGLRGAEDELRGLRVGSGGWGWTQGAEDGLRGLGLGSAGWGWAQGAEGSTQRSRPRQKDPHRHLPSKFQPAARGRTGDRSLGNDPRDKGAWRHCGYAEMVTLKQLWKSKRLTLRKLEWPPKGILNPQTLQNLLLATTALQRDKVQLHQPEHRRKLPQPGKHHPTLTQPGKGADSTTRITILRTFLNFFLFLLLSLINHAVHSPNISPPSY